MTNAASTVALGVGAVAAGAVGCKQLTREEHLVNDMDLVVVCAQVGSSDLRNIALEISGCDSIAGLLQDEL